MFPALPLWCQLVFYKFSYFGETKRKDDTQRTCVTFKERGRAKHASIPVTHTRSTLASCGMNPHRTYGHHIGVKGSHGVPAGGQAPTCTLSSALHGWRHRFQRWRAPPKVPFLLARSQRPGEGGLTVGLKGSEPYFVRKNGVQPDCLRNLYRHILRRHKTTSILKASARDETASVCGCAISAVVCGERKKRLGAAMDRIPSVDG